MQKLSRHPPEAEFHGLLGVSLRIGEEEAALPVGSWRTSGCGAEKKAGGSQVQVRLNPSHLVYFPQPRW